MSRGTTSVLLGMILLWGNAHSVMPDLVVEEGHWDNVLFVGLENNHTEVWPKLQFHNFLDFLFTEIIANYSTLSDSEKLVTFPSGEWMLIQLLSSDRARECVTFQIRNMSRAAIAAGHGLSSVVFYFKVYPWTGRERTNSVVQTGFRMIHIEGQNKVPESSDALSTMFQTCHDTARLKLGAFPCQKDFRSYGGTCNNLHHPRWGSYNQALRRSGHRNLDPSFIPGTNDFPERGMPNPRVVSRRLFRQWSPFKSIRGVTSMAVFWGQFIDHDIGLTPDSSKTVFEENMDIDILDTDDPLHSKRGGKLEFSRSRGVLDGRPCCGFGIAERVPRDPVNLQSSYIDASNVYGCNRERLYSLRLFENGKMQVGSKSKNGEDFLPRNRVSDIGTLLENHGPSSDDQFVAGDVRANEQPMLIALHTLFMREHNRIATLLVDRFPCWKDEKVFQYSRKIIMSQIQQLTYQFFVPAILGTKHGLAPYRGYQENVDPSIATFFSTCAFRFGHSMVPETLALLESEKVPHAYNGTKLHSVFFRPSFTSEIGIEPLLLGASHQIAESVDCQVVDSLQNELFKDMTGGADLISINIQRGRDHGIPKYNDAREMYGLKRKESISEVTKNETLQRILLSLYNSVSDIDSFVGGLAEDHMDDSELGELFHTALQDQFSRLRDGDRFFYKNISWPLELNNFEPVEEISGDSLTLQKIIVRNSGGTIQSEEFQQNIFQKP